MTDLFSKVLRIPNGAALSQVQQTDGTFADYPFLVGRLTPVGIIMPAAWTAAALTLRGGMTADALADVFDSAGIEVTIQAAASRFITLDPRALVGINFLVIRSGTSATPVNQGANRDLVLVYREFD